MRITGIEKVMIGMILVCILGLIAIMPNCMRDMKTIEQKGLKSVVNEIWEGKDAAKQGSR